MIVSSPTPICIEKVRPRSFQRFCRGIGSRPFGSSRVRVVEAITQGGDLGYIRYTDLVTLCAFSSSGVGILGVFTPGVMSPRGCRTVLSIVSSLFGGSSTGGVLNVHCWRTNVSGHVIH